MKTIIRLLTCLAVYAAPAPGTAQTADISNGSILVRTSIRSPAEVVDAIKSYVEAKKWVHMGALTVKPSQGAVTMVKFCIPQVGAAMWPVGLHLSALLPCGNVGIYQSKGVTEVTMLHPRYMHTLYPHPDVEKAAGIAAPLLLEMLDAITR